MRIRDKIIRSSSLRVLLAVHVGSSLLIAFGGLPLRGLGPAGLVATGPSAMLAYRYSEPLMAGGWATWGMWYLGGSATVALIALTIVAADWESIPAWLLVACVWLVFGFLALAPAA